MKKNMSVLYSQSEDDEKKVEFYPYVFQIILPKKDNVEKEKNFIFRERKNY